MPDDRPGVIVAEHLDPVCAQWLGERCRVTHLASDAPGFADLLKEAAGLVVRTYTKVDEALLDGAPNLRVVGRAGVGLDNIDRAACAARGVRVVHTPDANTQAVVEYVIALILDALRPRPDVGRAIGVDAWKSLRRDAMGAKQLGDCTLGIIGMGRVGQRLARCLAGFGTRVRYHDLIEIPVGVRFGAEPGSFEEVVSSCDILSVHVDDRASNRHLIGVEALARMPGGTLFINASRGFVVDAAALAAHLRADPTSRAVLDVHDPEPPGVGVGVGVGVGGAGGAGGGGGDYPLMGLANCRLLPHLGAATGAAHRNMSWVVRDVWRVLCGESPEHEAMPPGATMRA